MVEDCGVGVLVRSGMVPVFLCRFVFSDLLMAWRGGEEDTY